MQGGREIPPNPLKIVCEIFQMTLPKKIVQSTNIVNITISQTDRYAATQAQFCSALLAMIRLKQLRSGLARKKKVDYVLVFAGDGEVSNELEVFVDNPVVERLVQRWIDEGGVLGGFNIEKNNPIRLDRK